MRLLRSSMQDNFRIYRKMLHAKKKIFEQIRDVIMHDVRGVIRSERQNVKFLVTGEFIFQKAARLDIITNPLIFFNTDPKSTVNSRSIDDKLNAIHNDLVNQINDFLLSGSNWILKEVVHIDLKVTTHDPTRACGYLKLPEKFANLQVY